MRKLLWIVVLFTAGSLHARNLTTISLQGDIEFEGSPLGLRASIHYTIQNNSSASQSRWSVVVNPFLENVAAYHDGNRMDPRFRSTQHGLQLLSLNIPGGLEPGERTSITLSYTLKGNNSDPRFRIQDDFTFLDVRNAWLPLPEDGLSVTYDISITSPYNLHAVMGGKLYSYSNDQERRYTTWKSELRNLLLTGSLVLTEEEPQKIGDIYLYGDNEVFSSILSEDFSVHWEEFRANSFFALTELHVLVKDVPIVHEEFINGEFFGNLLVIHPSLLNSPDAKNIILDTLIHELFHAYLPGLLSVQEDDVPLLIENLVQMLNWKLAEEVDPDLHAFMKRRRRLYLLNFFLSQQFDYRWRYMVDGLLIKKSMDQSQLKSLDFIGILVEKYSYAGLDLEDIRSTLQVYSESYPDEIIHTDFFNHIGLNSLYNLELKHMTNDSDPPDINVLTDSPQEMLIQLSHNFPVIWHGQLHWIENEEDYFIDIALDPNEVYMTNLPAVASHIRTYSSLDDLELFLGDNVIDPQDIGYQILQSLNNQQTNNFVFNEQAVERQGIYFEDNLSYLWDSTQKLGNHYFVQAYLVDEENNRKFFSEVEITIENGEIRIVRILDPTTL